MPRPVRESLARYFALPAQPYRAASLELDYGDPGVLGRYIPTAKSVAVLELIAAALEDDSRDRALSLIAPYGSGKTSLLLFVAALLERHYKTRLVITRLLRRVKNLAPFTARTLKKRLARTKGYVVVPVSGYQGALPAVFARALRDALALRKLLGLWRGLSPPEYPSQSDVLDLYRTAARELSRRGYRGIVLIYDEFGKVLESQHGEARPADLFFLQSFAELCSRSGRHPLLLIVALHQGFAQYAHRLPSHVRNEWAKIEGRFRTVHYVEDSFQVYELIAQALKELHGPDFPSLHRVIGALSQDYTQASERLPCFAGLKDPTDRGEIFRTTFPLHPLALYVLPRLSARVAQNERTLFHFLLGRDQHCLFEILQRKAVVDGRPQLVTVADLFEYFSELMAADTGVGGAYRRLIEIKAALDRIEPDDTVAIEIVKTVGLLSILGERLNAPVSLDMLAFAIEGSAGRTAEAIEEALGRLVSRKILLHRRHTGEYRIWEGADLDLASLLRQKKAEVEPLLDLAEVVSGKVKAPLVFPHRYNEDFAITRAFEGQYVTVQGLERAIRTYRDTAWLRDTDGKILYVLADTPADIQAAQALAEQLAHPQLLVAIPRRPLAVADAVAELHCIEELLRDPGVTSEDPVIRRELSELADDCLVRIRETLRRFQDDRVAGAVWWHQGSMQSAIHDGVSLRRYLSEVCNTLFGSTPRFNNELINRRHPSPTICNARKKVLRAMLDHYGRPDFRLTGYGPDVSIFRAVYLVTGLYREAHPGLWRFAGPEDLEDRNLRRVIQEIHGFFLGAQDQPLSLGRLIETLTAPPYGLREGVLPLLLAAATKSFLLPLNLMDQGVYVKELKAETFERMTSHPDEVTVQCVPLPAHVRDYLEGVKATFSVNGGEARETTDPLRAAVETVYQWVHQLPPCALESYQVSAEARELRRLLMRATDPVRLLFVDIPRTVLKLQTETDGEPWLSPEAYRQVIDKVHALQEQLEAVEGAYLDQVAQITRRVFKLTEGGVEGLKQGLREWLSDCAGDLGEYVDDPQCAGLLERIRTQYETDRKLAESLASLVTGRSLSHWDDTYVRQYELGLLSLHAKLTHTNSLLAKRLGSSPAISVKERVPDPILWERLERLDDADRELLAHYLLNTIR